VGAAPTAEIVWPRISKEGAAKTHFSRLIARPLAVKTVKKAPDGGGVFACPENRPVSHPCMQTHLPNHLWCNHHSLKRLCGVGQPKRCEQVLKQAKWRKLLFLGCPRSRQEFGDNPRRDKFLKTLCNHCIAGDRTWLYCLPQSTIIMYSFY
jgi:hypothetical protein